ncbi:MAG: putative secreted protein [Patescibacteria group bacterium]|nr:putative secreted protein [Patescibacteria group bacterium]
MKQIYLKILAIVTITLGSMAAPIVSAANSSPGSGGLADYNASGKTTADGTPLTHWAAGRGAGPVATLKSAPDLTALAATTPEPECPLELKRKCHFVPAAYQQVDPNDSSNYGNYDLAERPSNGLKVNSVVIHDTEGSLADTLAHFQDPTAYVSAHYVIDADGSIYQMVATKNVAWHAGNWYVNQHSIGIEHVGHAVQGQTEYTPQMYRSSALLTKWLASKYSIPLDRQHILGHDNVPAPIAGLVAGMHWDPGPYWNWQRYFNLLGAPIVPTAGPNSSFVTIAPTFSSNQPVVTDCSTSPCVTLPSQGANFVYLRTAPSDSAPLLSDPALHTDGAPGTTDIKDWSATADYGQQFAVAARQQDWTGIWFGGQIGWFKKPQGHLASYPTRGQSITPKTGLSSIPVYGRAYPEAGAYSGGAVPVQSVVPLQYTIPGGQSYATSGLAPTDYYYAWTIDAHLPDDHTVVIGQDKYYQIQFNQRLAYVKASDVVVDAH